MSATTDALDSFYGALYEAQRKLAAEERGKAADAPALVSWGRPVESDALAVHPSQVEEAREDARKKGVPVEFLPDGRPVFTSSRQFREYAKRYGFRHKGY